MGADFIDYVIADEIALPFDQQPFFAEKIVHLPGCFLVTDDRQEVAADTPSREEAGLPPDGFVFCSFNNSYKLAKPVFEVWMRLLAAVPGSVLWLAEANPDMAINLRREAQRCSIAPERLVFVPRVPLPQHLARQRLAGVFLDTAPYNAGATGIAALWSGIPLLTILGQTFVGRMAASMLHAVGLPELVTQSLEDYEALALKLALDPDLLSDIRHRLRENLRVTRLFDTDRFRRHLEAAYSTMEDIRRRGEPPRSFHVDHNLK
jgi:predicted O-linked N-acetylglucosamine transferase (SPINDLY family)